MLKKIQNMLKNSDFIVSIIFLLLGFILLQQTIVIKEEQSRLFPWIGVIIFFISGVSLMAGAIKKKGRDDNNKELKFGKKELIVFSMLIVNYFTLKMLGFYTSIFLLLVFVYLCIEDSWSKGAIKSSIIFSLVFTVILYLVFAIFLKIVIPAGLLI